MSNGKPKVIDVRGNGDGKPIVPESIIEDFDPIETIDVRRKEGEVGPLFQPSRQDIFGSITGEFQDLSKLDRGILPGMDQNLFRARNQSGLDQFGNFLNQALLGEVVGGTIEGLGYLFDFQDHANNIAGTNDEFGNWLSDIGKGLKEFTRDVTPIFEAEPGKFRPGDSGWWAGNGVSVASTLSLLIPAVGTVKAATALSNATKIGRQIGVALNATKVGQLAEPITQAIFSRHMENMMEASQVFDTTLEDRLGRGFTTDAATESASKAAASTYNSNWMMLVQDIPQYILLGTGFRGRAPKTAKIKRALADQGIVSPSSAINPTLVRPLLVAGDMVGEGFEEAYQFTVAEEARHLADVEDGLTPETPFSKRLKEYSRDGELWTASFFGAFGAGIFQTAGRQITKGISRIGRDIVDIEGARITEISSRNTRLTLLNKKLREAEATGDPELIKITEDALALEMYLKAAVLGDQENFIEWFQNVKKISQEEKDQLGVTEDFIQRIDGRIRDMQNITNKFNRNRRNFNEIAEPLTKNEFLIEKLQQQKPQVQAKALELQASLPRVSELSAIGAEILEATLDVRNAQQQVFINTTLIDKRGEDITPELTLKYNQRLETAKKTIEQRQKDIAKLRKEERTTEEKKKDTQILKGIKGFTDDLIKERSRLTLLEQDEQTLIDQVNEIKKPDFIKKMVERERVDIEIKEIAGNVKNRRDAVEVADAINQMEKVVKEANLSDESRAAFASTIEGFREGAEVLLKDKAKQNVEILREQVKQKKAKERVQEEVTPIQRARRVQITNAIQAIPKLSEVSPIIKVRWEGKEGYIERDGQTFIFIPADNPNQEFEIPIPEGKSADSKLFSLGIFLVDEYSLLDEINILDNGNYIIRNTEYINRFSDKLQAINRNDNGDVISVTLSTIDGKPRTFKKFAEELAYLITLEQITKGQDEIIRAREQAAQETIETAKRQEPQAKVEDIKETEVEESTIEKEVGEKKTDIKETQGEFSGRTLQDILDEQEQEIEKPIEDLEVTEPDTEDAANALLTKENKKKIEITEETEEELKEQGYVEQETSGEDKQFFNKETGITRIIQSDKQKKEGEAAKEELEASLVPEDITPTGLEANEDEDIQSLQDLIKGTKHRSEIGDPPIRVTPSPVTGYVLTTDRESVVVDKEGKATINNPENNISLQEVGNPNIKIGSEVTFELGTNDWWEQRKDVLDPVQQQPIFVLFDGTRIGILEANHPDRVGIHQNLKEGRETKRFIAPHISRQGTFSKLLSIRNLTNKKVGGRPHFLSIREALSTQWVETSEGKFELQTVDPHIITTKGVEDLPPGSKVELDLDNSPSNIANDLSSVNLQKIDVDEAGDSISQRGQVWAAIMSPSGVFFPAKVHTSTLDRAAIDKIEDIILTTETVSNITNDVNDIVYAESDTEFAGISPFFFKITQGEKVAIQFKDKSNQIISIELDEFKRAMNSNGVGRVQIKELDENDIDDGKSRPHKLKTIGERNDYLIKQQFEGFLNKKRYNIRKNLLNTTIPFTSPVTGTKYKSYNEYLSSPTETASEVSILSSDILNTNGNMFFDTGISFSKNKEQQLPTRAIKQEDTDINVSREDNPFDDDTNTLYSVADTTGETININEATDWLKERGIDSSVFPDMRTLGDKVIQGYFSRGTIALWEGANKGTEYHEAFHAVFRIWNTDEQQRIILNEAKQRYGDLSDLNLEERMAEEFRRSVLERKEPSAFGKSAIGQFLTKIWNYIQTYFGNRGQIDELYDRIADNRINKEFARPVLSLSPDPVLSLKTAFTADSQREIVEHINTLFLDQIDEAESTGKLPKPSEIYELIRGSILTGAFKEKDTVGDDHIDDITMAKILYEKIKGTKTLAEQDTIIKEEGLERTSRYGIFIRIYKGWFDKRSGDERDNIEELGWRTLSKNNMVKFGIKIIEDEGERIEESSEGERIWSKSHLEDNNRNKLSGDIKGFLSRIRSNKLNVLGIRSYIPFENVYAKVTQATADAVSFDDMIQRMKELSSKSPELTAVIDRLNAVSKDGVRLYDGQFIADFYKNLALTNVNFLGAIEEVIIDENGKSSLRVRYFNANTARIGRLVTDRWRNNAKNVDGTGLYVKNREGNWLTDKKKITQLEKLSSIISEVKTDKTEVEEKHIKALSSYLETLGIDIGIDNLTKALRDGIRIGNRFVKPTVKEDGTIINTEARLYRYIYDKQSPLNNGSPALFNVERDLRDNKDIFETQSGIIKRAIQIQQEFETQTNVSFINAEGKLIYPMNNITTFDRMFTAYKNYDPEWTSPDNKNTKHKNFWNRYVDSFWKDVYYNPLDGDIRYASLFLSQIKTNKQFRDILKWEIFDGYKRRGETITNNTYENLTEITTILNRYNSFLNNSNRNEMKIAAPIFGDRGRMAFITIPRISQDTKLMHKSWSINLDTMLLGQVLQDLARATKASEDIRDDKPLIENYHTGSKRAFKYTQFEFLNNKKKYPEATALMKFATASSQDQLVGLFEGGIRKQNTELEAVLQNIKDYIQTETQKELDTLKRLEIDEGNRNTFDSSWKSLYSTKEDFVRDFVTADILSKNEIRKMTAGDLALYNSYENFSKRYSITQTPGLESLELSMFPEGNYGDFSNYGSSIIRDAYTITKELETLRGKSKQLDGILDLYKKENDNGTKGSNKTDAMGFTTLKKHRAKMRGQGIWTEIASVTGNHEEAYKNYIRGKEFKDNQGKFPLLTPLKTVHDGMYFLPNLGRVVRIVHKHSTFPLLREFTRGSELFDGLRRRMELEGEFSDLPEQQRLDEVNTETAVKVGKFSVSDIANKDGSFNVEAARNMTVTTLSTKFQRTPQVIPNNNAPTIWGSQIRKLMIANLKSHFDDTYVIGGKEMTGKKVYDLYHEATGELINKSREQLFGQDGLKYQALLDAQLNSPELSQVVQKAKLEFLKELRSRLQTEVDERELPDNYREAVQIEKINGDYDFRLPLAFPPYQRRFEQILISVFKRDLLTQHMNGKAMVQIAELGGTREDGDLEFIRLEGEKVKHAHIAIPYDVAQVMQLPKNANGEFDLSKVPPNLLTMIGYRIPTHGKNTTLPLKVVRILPRSMGKVILVPGGITTQMGSDFDIDKLFLMMPNYETSQEGLTDFEMYKAGLKEYSLSDEDIRALMIDPDNADAISQVEDRPSLRQDTSIVRDAVENRRKNKSNVKKVAYNISKLSSTSREGIENLIIDINEGILLNKNHLEEMLNPVSSISIKESANRLGRKEKALDPQSPNTERVLEDRNKIGNTGVGIYVNALNGSAIGQYSDQIIGDERVNLRLVEGFELELDNTVYTDLTRERDDVGDHITFSYSELLDTSVDNANDPVMSFVNDNSFTSPVTTLMLRTGAVNQAKEGWLAKGNVLPILLRNQPIILDLTTEFINGERTLNELADVVNEVGRKWRKGFDIFDAENSTTKSMTTDNLIEGADLSKEKILATKTSRKFTVGEEVINEERSLIDLFLDARDASDKSLTKFMQLMGLGNSQFIDIVKAAEDQGTELTARSSERGSLGTFFISKNEISIDTFALLRAQNKLINGRKRSSQELLELIGQAVAHESVHAILHSVIKNKSKFSKFNADLIRFVEEIKDHINELPANLQGVANSISESGVPEELVTFGFTNPDFAKWLNSIPTKKVIKGSQAETLGQRLKEIIQKIINAVTGSFTKLDELSALVDFHLGDQTDILRPTRVTNEKNRLLDNQIDVLTNFYHFHNAGRMLNKVHRVFNTDRVRELNSVAAIEEFDDLIDNVTNANRNKFIEGYEPILNNEAYPNTLHFLKAINDAGTFSDIFFPYRSNAMIDVKKRIREAVNRENLPKDILNVINRESFLWLSTIPQSAPFSVFNSKMINQLILGDNNIAVQLQEIKALREEFPALENNRFLQKLQPHPDNAKDGNKLATLAFDYSFSMTQFEQSELTDNFRLLLRHKDERVRTFAKNLVHYHIVSLGFNPTVNSFIEFIPIEVWNDPSMGFTSESLNDYLRIAMRNLDKRAIFSNRELSDVEDSSHFIDTFLENNSHIRGLIPKAKSIKATVARKKFTKSIAFKDEHWARYIKQYDRTLKQDVLYKIDDSSNGTYVRINKRGIAFKVKEYHMDASVVNTEFDSKASQKETQKKRISREVAETMLSSLEAQFGIKGEIKDGVDLKWAGKYFNGVPTINVAYAGLDTPFHEFSHPWIDLIEKKNQPLFSNLARQLKETDHGRQVMEKTETKYPELEGNDLLKEAMVTTIGELAADNTDINTGSPLIRVAKRVMDRIREWMQNLFGITQRITPAMLNENSTLQNLADLISASKEFKIEAVGTREIPTIPGTPTGVTSDNLQKLDNEAEFLNNLVNRLRLKEERLKRSLKGGKEAGIARKALQARLKKGEFKLGIIDFTAFAERQTLEQLNIVTDIEEKIAATDDFDEKRRLLRQLVKAEDSVSSYEIVGEVFDSLKGEEFEDTSLGTIKINAAFNAEVIAPIQNRIVTINRTYRRLGKDVVTDFLFKENRDPNLTREEIEQMLTHVSEDITSASRWINGMAESSDQVLALVDRVVSKQRASVLAKTTKFKNTELRPVLEELERFQKSKGVNVTNLRELYGFMLQRDKDGKLTGRYIKPAELALPESDPRMKFAVLFDDTYNESWRLLPESLRRGNQLIPIIKSATERLFEGRGAKELAKEQFEQALIKRLDDVDLVQEIATDEKGNEFRFIPTRYTSNIDQVSKDNISLDMGSNILKFMTMAENFSAMQSVITELEVVKDLVAERDVEIKKGGILNIKKVTREPVIKKGRESNAFKRLDDYFTMIIYGQRKKDQGSWNFMGQQVDRRKAADLLAKYTSFNVLALNLYSGINNVVIAQVMNAIEGSGGQFYESRHFWAAQAEYWKILPGFLKDATQRFNDSNIGIWMETYDVLQIFDEFGNHIKGNKFIKRIGLHNTFFLHQSGEHMIQTQLAIAMGKSHRIDSGKIFNYSDWVLANDKKFTKESKTEFEKLPDVYSNVVLKEGVTSTKIALDEGEMINFAERIKGLYSRLHGNYGRKDQAALQQGAFGMLAMLFRKWLKPGYDRRFDKETFDGRDKFDQRLGANISGNYTTAINFIRQLHKESKQLGGVRVAFGKQWEVLPQWKKQAMFKAMAEIGYIAASMTIVFALAGMDDEDDVERTWLFHMGEYQAYRLRSELLFYIPPFALTEAMRIIRSPAASLNSFEKMGKVFLQLTPVTGFERYEKGDNKGELKLLKYSRDLVPFWNQIERAVTDVEENANWMKR